MDQQIGWKRLKCDCGSEQFALTFHVKWKPGGGTTTEPSGYQCVQCQTQMDAKYLIDRANLKLKREEYERMRQEMEEEGVIGVSDDNGQA